jgi:hypothetical protein
VFFFFDDFFAVFFSAFFVLLGASVLIGFFALDFFTAFLDFFACEVSSLA